MSPGPARWAIECPGGSTRCASALPAGMSRSELGTVQPWRTTATGQALTKGPAILAVIGLIVLIALVFLAITWARYST